MKICPITYEEITRGRYSEKGIKSLDRRLDDLRVFPYSLSTQLELAEEYSSGISIQGIQPKIPAKINVKDNCFESVLKGNKFILKPQHEHFQQLPENEDLTMRLASMAGIEVPLHGLIWNIDDSMTYFVKRFDRKGRNNRIAVEDFCQLAGLPTKSKYNFTTEKLSGIIERFCTFPTIEKLKLFRIVILSYLTGNEDMHLKNYSLIRRDNKIELAPAYDLINTSIVIRKPVDETALPLRGKKSGLNFNDLIIYFGGEIMGLNRKITMQELERFSSVFDKWKKTVEISFLSDSLKNRYLELLKKRGRILSIQ